MKISQTVALLLLLALSVASAQDGGSPDYGGAAGGDKGEDSGEGDGKKFAGAPGGRNVKEANEAANDALNEVLGELTPGDLSQMPEPTLDRLPPSALAKLPPDVLETLPDHLQQKLAYEAHIKSMALGQIIHYMPINKLVKLPWDELIDGVPASAMNGFSPTTLGAIPWTDVFSKVPPDTMSGLSIRVFQIVPPGAWESISFEQLRSIKPMVLSEVPLTSLKKIPRGHLKKLGPEILSAFDKDVLAAVDPELVKDALSQGSALGGGGESVADAQGEAAQAVDSLGGEGGGANGVRRRLLAARARRARF